MSNHSSKVDVFENFHLPDVYFAESGRSSASPPSRLLTRLHLPDGRVTIITQNAIIDGGSNRNALKSYKIYGIWIRRLILQEKNTGNANSNKTWETKRGNTKQCLRGLEHPLAVHKLPPNHHRLFCPCSHLKVGCQKIIFANYLQISGHWMLIKKRTYISGLCTLIMVQR